MHKPKSAQLVFVLHPPPVPPPIVIPCPVECVITYFNKVYSLKEHEAIFSRRKN